MRTSLIVACGGSGSRFEEGISRLEKGAQIPDTSQPHYPSKLFYPLSNSPIFFHTVKPFVGIPQVKEILLAVPRGTEDLVKKTLRPLKIPSLKVIAGGRTRAESVLKALSKTKKNHDWIMVHDGARPFIREENVRRLFKEAKGCDGVILAKKMTSTIKRLGSGGSIQMTINRELLREAETPQLVRRSLLEKAFKKNKGSEIEVTDEANLIESVGGEVKVLLHEGWNPKITTYQDYLVAKAYAERNDMPEVRSGFGRDTHRLVKGRKFYLGGIRLPADFGPLGHSDGDALLHAVTDAILGAVSAGDIGDWFSDRNPKYKNIASSRLLAEVMSFVEDKGWRLVNVDTVVILESPKLGLLKPKIAENIAKLLGMKADTVSVKAKTLEGLGPEGQGLAVTCDALVTMKKVSSK